MIRWGITFSSQDDKNTASHHEGDEIFNTQRYVYLELLLATKWKSFDCSEQVSKAAEHGFCRERQTVAAMTQYHTAYSPFLQPHDVRSTADVSVLAKYRINGSDLRLWIINNRR